MAADAPCRVLLVGMMGSGKSTVGRLLAEATGWAYLDNDELVHRAQGMTARRILAEGGESRLREAEAAALALGLATPAPALIGVAAGTILEAAHRERMRAAGIVVWLRADADALVARAAGAEHRPWIEGGDGAWMRAALAERDPLYAAVADVTVDTGARPPRESATEILARLAGFGTCGEALDLERPA